MRPARPRTRTLPILAALLAVATIVGGTAVDPAAAGPAAAPDILRGDTGRTIHFRGVSVAVPAGWPVVDLTRDPAHCIRLDREAVYLGNPAPDAACTGSAVGGRRAIWVGLDAAGRAVPAPVGTADLTTLRAAAADAPTAVVAAPSPDAPVASAPAAAVPPPAPRTLFRGLGIDTCVVPGLGLIDRWQASPYRVIGAYIGGVNRGCVDAGLSAAYLSGLYARGWGVLPIYVGRQSPCSDIGGVRRMSTTNARAEGVADARDAVTQARRFGIGAGATLFMDIEHYTGGDWCRTAVMDFMAGWSGELHRYGYRSGAYGGGSSLMADLSRAITTRRTGNVAVDQVWFGRWNYLQRLDLQYEVPAFLDTLWTDHQRAHQYWGPHRETWGGVTTTIDSNLLDLEVTGRARPVDYGAFTTGPGGAGFVLTGDVRSWRSRAGLGLRRLAHEVPARSTESHGATWTNLSTSVAGSYVLSVHVPVGAGTGVGVYTVRHAGGTSVVRRHQATKGWVSLGSFAQAEGRPLSVHLGNNGGSGTVVADALRFTLPSATPSAPARATAAPGGGEATVHWTAATPNASAVVSYQVTASPGGRSVVVGPAQRSATVTGLTPGVRYDFTVRAKNSAGIGAARQTARPETVRAPAFASTIAPAEALAGVAAVRRVLGPDEQLAVPIPTAADGSRPTSVIVNVGASGGTAPGFIAPVGSDTSLLNYRAGQRVLNTGHVVVAADGTIALVNRSAGSVDLSVEVQMSTVPSAGQRVQALTPTRVADTRVGTVANPEPVSLAPGESRSFRVAGSGTPVPLGAPSVAVNVTALSSGEGMVRVGGRAGASVVAFGASGPSANLLWTTPAEDGTVVLANDSDAPLDLVLDVQGHGVDGEPNWLALDPLRLMDTRRGTWANPSSTQVPANRTVEVRVRDVLGSNVPPTAASALLNLTVTGTGAPGYLVVDSGSAVTASSVNFRAGQSAANSVLVPLSAQGTIRVTNRSAAPLDLIVDALAHLR